MLKKITLLALSSAAAFAMHNAEININNKDLELGARLDMGQFNDSLHPDSVFVGMKFLKGDGDHSDIDSANIKDFYEMNFLMQRRMGSSDFTLGLGVKMNHTENFTSIPLGIEAKYKLPVGDVIPMYLGGSFYFAPEVLTMADGNNFLEFRVQLDVEVIPNANIIAGYRSIDTNYEYAGVNHDVNYNQSAYIGFKFAF